MFEIITDYYKKSLKTLGIFCLYLVLARFTQGAFLGVMILMGMIWAFNSKVGKALPIYVMIMFMVSIYWEVAFRFHGTRRILQEVKRGSCLVRRSKRESYQQWC